MLIKQVLWAFLYPVLNLYIIKGVISMANRDIKKDVKKKKKTDTVALPSLKPLMPEPEIVKKPKKN
jgi:hypothetical protein